MRKLILPFALIFITFQAFTQVDDISEEEDKKLLSNIFEKLSSSKDQSTAELVVQTGKLLIGTPYVAHTLENEKEQLIVNLRGLDCTTYAENCLAIARSIKSGKPNFEKFTKELQQIRYRNGVIDGYPSRLHYFSDWIHENNKREFIIDVSKQISNITYPLQVNFMSTHPDSYQKLKNNPEAVKEIASREQEISTRKMYFLPKENLANYEAELQEGDIIGITTSIEGLDITHVGILVRNDSNKRIHLMHASSAGKKVLISENTLEDYLNNNSRVTGIMVVRPK